MTDGVLLYHDCPNCKRYQLSASMWRNEAYKRAGTPLPWEPEELLREALEAAKKSQEQIATLTAMCETLNKLQEIAVEIIKPAIEAAVLKEREANARVLDEMADQMVADMEPSAAVTWVRNKAAEIRAKGRA